MAHDDPVDMVTAQWFIGRVSVEFEVAEDVASVNSLHGTTTDKNIFKEFGKN